MSIDVHIFLNDFESHLRKKGRKPSTARKYRADMEELLKSQNTVPPQLPSEREIGEIFMSKGYKPSTVEQKVPAIEEYSLWTGENANSDYKKGVVHHYRRYMEIAHNI